MKHTQASKDVRNYKTSLTVLQNFMNSIHKRLKIGPEFLPTLSILFRPAHTL